MKLSNISLFVAVAIVLIAAIAWGAYSLGRSSSESDLVAMKNEVDDLKAKEKDAAIVKRVSQQMEAIAYEQMNISNKQRDRAEQQTRLAEANAERAEQQSRLAQQNASEARQQSRLAERNAESARHAAEEARKQRDVATLSKSISDTLSFRTLSRSLGTTATAKFESNERELGCILAYASWYFADIYKGNVYQEETFEALVEATNGVRRFEEPPLGVVHDIATLPGNNVGCVAVTNYGEIEIIEKDRPRLIMQDKDYDFRSVWLCPDRVLALSYDGRLCVLDYNRRLSEVSLPDDKYMEIVAAGPNSVVITAHRSVTWFDTRSMSVVQSYGLDKDLSVAVVRNDKVLLFFKDGSCGEMDHSGNVSSKPAVVKDVVTAAIYDKRSDLTFLGTKQGGIAVLNGQDDFQTMLNGHMAQITSMSMTGEILVSGSFDKNVFVWNLPKLKTGVLETGLSIFSGSNDKATPTEWLVPASYVCSGWGLAVGTQKDYMWIGQSDGKIVRECISVDKMARQAYAKMKRGLTQEEWMQYVGPYAEYVDLK